MIESFLRSLKDWINTYYVSIPIGIKPSCKKWVTVYIIIYNLRNFFLKLVTKTKNLRRRRI